MSSSLSSLLLFTSCFSWNCFVAVCIFLSIISKEKKNPQILNIWITRRNVSFYKNIKLLQPLVRFTALMRLHNKLYFPWGSFDVPAHLGFVSASQSSLPVASEWTSCQHAPTADARLSIAVRLQQQTNNSTEILKCFHDQLSSLKLV